MDDPASKLPPLLPRILWLGGGHLFLAVGIIGIFLPLLPTTPFLLLASFCYSRGSRKFELWLIHHPRLGPMVRDWRQHRVIRLRAKLTALAMIAASIGYVLTRDHIPWIGKGAVLALTLPAALFVATRASKAPDPDQVPLAAAKPLPKHRA